MCPSPLGSELVFHYKYNKNSIEIYSSALRIEIPKKDKVIVWKVMLRFQIWDERSIKK